MKGPKYIIVEYIVGYNTFSHDPIIVKHLIK